MRQSSPLLFILQLTMVTTSHTLGEVVLDHQQHFGGLAPLLWSQLTRYRSWFEPLKINETGLNNWIRGFQSATL